MTGHFISSTTAQRPDGVTVQMAGGGEAAASGGAAAGGGATVQESEAQVDGAAGDGAQTGDAAAQEGASPYSGDEDAVLNVNAQPDGDAGAGESGAQQAVRDGYSIVGEAYAAGGEVADEDRIYVYVTGAVKAPGVYALARSSMVIDAVELAGGFTEQADAENVNMVFRLESNAMLNIKRKPAAPVVGREADVGGGGTADAGAMASAEAGQAATSSTGNGGSELYGNAVEINYNYDGIVMTGDNAANAPDGPGAKRVNINTAQAEELATLPGIGKATADNIIAFRNKQKFNKIEDLMKVSGIKQAKFDAVKELITC